MQNQNRRFWARRESLPCGTEMPGQNIRFADPLIVEKAICRLRVRPIFGRPRRCRTYSARELLQQLSQPLAMANVLELASHYFIADPFSRPRPRKVSALRGPNTSRI